MLDVERLDVHTREVTVRCRNNHEMTGFASMPQGNIITIYCRFYAITGLSRKVKLQGNHADLKPNHRYTEVHSCLS